MSQHDTKEAVSLALDLYHLLLARQDLRKQAVDVMANVISELVSSHGLSAMPLRRVCTKPFVPPKSKKPKIFVISQGLFFCCICMVLAAVIASIRS
ncbi:hypothetical protein K431DRAFT_139675 [Polychaeton citri CBS 116435]|uniref:Uncharacterized protein n=1 Tax=Polychaeton citri CBS 116435 TaxID=1314669 RepID=A0A9P4Q4E4_9PEZI|nr:hypothetical protein K431DRAFT_139675 [Polychaeton citri CBS 116435]